MENIRLLLISLSILIASGCAFNPQKANLTPNVNVTNSSIGNNTSVFVNVLDERVDRSLGRRGTAYGAAAEITAEQDLAEVVKSEITRGLSHQGFIIADRASAQVTLTIEVRALDYSTSQGFWTGGVHIKGALKGRAEKESNQYEKMYRYEKEERVVVVPTAKTNERWINEALSETLSQLLEDTELLFFLAKN